MSKRDSALDVQCPRCWAPPGRPCRKVDTKTPVRYIHALRSYEAAEQAEQVEVPKTKARYS